MEQRQSHFIRHLLILNVIILITIFAGVYLLFQNMQNSQLKGRQPGVGSDAANSQTSAPVLPVLDPNSKTAKRFFPVNDSNAIDFREDGSEGDFLINLERKDQSVKLRWNTAIKATSVTVYNLNRLDDLSDHTIVFAISSVPQGQSAKNAKPTQTYIPNSYTIGQIPQGLYNTTPVTQKKASIFSFGGRYSIEIYGSKDNKRVMASYTFTY